MKGDRIAYSGGYKYQLRRWYMVETGITGHLAVTPWLQLERDGKLWIRQGYAWDGPSGPTIDTLTFMRGSLVHDALYQLIRLQLVPADLRDEADKILRRICLEDGMNAIRAWWVYQGVKWFGGPCADGHAEPKIEEAP